VESLNISDLIGKQAEKPCTTAKGAAGNHALSTICKNRIERQTANPEAEGRKLVHVEMNVDLDQLHTVGNADVRASTEP
jgi:hypothetical protein